MAQTLYCWRCKREVPMLEEHEWEQISPRLSGGIQEIQDYRTKHNVSLEEARKQKYGQEALDFYFKITGFRETNFDVLWHHRLSKYGPPCRTCGKPLRTPQAKLCAACGTAKNTIRKKFVLVVIATALIVAVLSKPVSHLTWFRTSDVSLIYDGKPAPTAKIYRHQGDILLDLGLTSSMYAYVISPENNSVSVSFLKYPYWWIVTDLLALAKRDPPFAIDMRDEKAGRHDPQLTVTPETITFTDENGVTVRLEK